MLFQKKENPILVNGIELIPITKTNLKDLTKYYIDVKPNKITANALTGLLLFGGNNYYNILDDYLFLYHYYQDKLSLVTIPFDSKNQFIELSKILDFMMNHEIYRIRFVLDSYFKQDSDWLNVLKRYFKINKLYCEYVLSTEKLSALNGGEYKHLRQDCNRIKRQYNITYRICTIKDKNNIEVVYNLWCDKSGYKYNHVYDKVYLFNTFELDPTRFLMFFDGNKPIGFINYYEVNDNFVYCGSIKFDIDYKSISKYMEHKLAEYLYERGYLFMNIDADDNSKGLIEFKNSLKPVYKMIEYQLIVKE